MPGMVVSKFCTRVELTPVAARALCPSITWREGWYHSSELVARLVVNCDVSSCGTKLQQQQGDEDWYHVLVRRLNPIDGHDKKVRSMQSVEAGSTACWGYSEGIELPPRLPMI